MPEGPLQRITARLIGAPNSTVQSFSFSIPRRIRPWLARANDMASQVAQVSSVNPTKVQTHDGIRIALYLVLGTMID